MLQDKRTAHEKVPGDGPPGAPFWTVTDQNPIREAHIRVDQANNDPVPNYGYIKDISMDLAALCRRRSQKGEGDADRRRQ